MPKTEPSLIRSVFGELRNSELFEQMLLIFEQALLHNEGETPEEELMARLEGISGLNGKSDSLSMRVISAPQEASACTAEWLELRKVLQYLLHFVYYDCYYWYCYYCCLLLLYFTVFSAGSEFIRSLTGKSRCQLNTVCVEARSRNSHGEHLSSQPERSFSTDQ
jgi:hypothetical protein